MTNNDDPTLRTGIATSTPDRIVVRGRDLVDEVLGEMDFGSAVYLHLTGQDPTPSDARVTNALLTVMVEHGLTPSAIAARLTYGAAPESVQGATASGLLGTGPMILGTMEPCGRLLQSATPYEDVDTAATELVDGRDDPFPGIGHFEHTERDPRAEKLFDLAKEESVYGDHCTLLTTVQSSLAARSDAALPVNAAGAVAAVGSDVGFDWWTLKGFALIGRAAGLMGHLAEERSDPLAGEIWRLVQQHAEYTGSWPGDEK